MKNPNNINGISPAEVWNFDIDAYISPFIPSPRIIRRLPTCISRFLGHRNGARGGELDIVVWTWAFVGAFAGVAIVETVFINWSYFVERGCPMIVGSYGAAAILLYGAVDSPLAQPRNAFFGQVLSAATGVAVTKLFLLNSNFDSLVWLAGAFACASSSLIMTITKTVHPPAGATALLAAVDPAIRGIGWGLVPVVIVSSALMISVACIVDNFQRSYPRYWWTPGPVGKEARSKDFKADGIDMEKGKVDTKEDMEVVVGAEGIVIPEFLALGEVEREVLMQIRCRIADFNDGRRESESSSL
ncbi:HPP family-domain-containing protein [Tuber indicum]|nr:HPP family-domain-containing protein [Tuber indicum]